MANCGGGGRVLTTKIAKDTKIGGEGIESSKMFSSFVLFVSFVVSTPPHQIQKNSNF